MKEVRLRKRHLILGFVGAVALFEGVAQLSAATLKKAAEFDLPGPAGKRFDYLSIAADEHYLISEYAPPKDR